MKLPSSTKTMQPNSLADVKVAKTIWRNMMQQNLRNQLISARALLTSMLTSTVRTAAASAILIASFSIMPVLAQTDLYTLGQSQLDSNNYLAAEETFSALVETQTENRDAALYWLAYAQYKGREDQAAIKTLETLTKEYANSKWINDARALMVEIQDARGDSVDIDDEEMKLYALNSLMNSPSERSLEILQKILTGNSSERIKRRALFVLSQISDPKAFAAIAEVAKDSDSRNLRNEAIHVLGISGSPSAMSLLQEIYHTAEDTQIRAEVLQSYMIANQGQRLIELAKTEADPKLRKKAIQLVGVLSKPELLLDMYREPNFKEYKKDLIQAIAIGNGTQELLQIIGFENEETWKIAAVKNLGITRHSSSSEVLQSLYQNNQSRAVRKAIIQAMLMQENSNALLAIVKTEKDPELKREAMQSLSMMDSDAALDFFDEVLNEEN